MNGKKCEVEVFARVTGFFRPVQSWNRGKTEEFKGRKKFNLPEHEEEEAAENDNSRNAKTVVG